MDTIEDLGAIKNMVAKGKSGKLPDQYNKGLYKYLNDLEEKKLISNKSECDRSV